MFPRRPLDALPSQFDMLPLFLLLADLLEARMGTPGCLQRAVQFTAAGPFLVCRESLCRCVFLATRGVRAGVSHTVCFLSSCPSFAQEESDDREGGAGEVVSAFFLVPGTGGRAGKRTVQSEL